MAMIHSTPTSSTQPLAGSEPMPWAPNSRKTYWPAPGHRLREDGEARRDGAPPAAPAGLGPERAGGPGERGATVGVGLVQLAVADRGQQHRHEGQHGHDGRPEAD